MSPVVPGATRQLGWKPPRFSWRAFNMEHNYTIANPICQPNLGKFYHGRVRKPASTLDFSDTPSDVPIRITARKHPEYAGRHGLHVVEDTACIFAARRTNLEQIRVFWQM